MTDRPILHLALKAQYFNEIKAGTKTEEYRLVNEYWIKRLCPHGEQMEFSGIVLTLGYPKADDHSRRLELPWRGFTIKTITHPHFGHEPVKVFAINVCNIDQMEGANGTP